MLTHYKNIQAVIYKLIPNLILSNLASLFVRVYQMLSSKPECQVKCKSKHETPSLSLGAFLIRMILFQFPNIITTVTFLLISLDTEFKQNKLVSLCVYFFFFVSILKYKFH